MKSFLQRFGSKITGVLSGFDRLRFRGTKRWLACAAGVVGFLRQLGVPLDQFGQFVEARTEQLCSAIKTGAAAAGRPLVYLASSEADKDERARQLVATDVQGWTEGTRVRHRANRVSVSERSRGRDGNTIQAWPLPGAIVTMVQGEPWVTGGSISFHNLTHTVFPRN